MPKVTATGICERADLLKKDMYRFAQHAYCFAGTSRKFLGMRKFCVFTPEYVRVKCFLVPFDFSARVCGEKILNMQRCFSFSTSCRQSATKRTYVFFIADRSVKRSVLVCWLFRRQSNKKGKDRGSVLSCLGL